MVCREFRHTTQHGAIEDKKQIKTTILYNLDVIISVGYRVKSQRGTQFRQWATQRLKDYLVQGYAINEKLLAQKQQEVEHLKTGIRILNRAIEQQATEDDSQMLRVFARGLALLDDYDHQTLETKGKTLRKTTFPSFDQYMELIQTMYSEFASNVFALPKDDSFHSSINQIAQSFGGVELYPSIEEKNYSFSAGQYFEVKIEHTDITAEEFNTKMSGFTQNLETLFAESASLEVEIKKQLGGLKYE